MSVINKMLRDLDHRQADAAAAQPAVRQGTVSVLQHPAGAVPSRGAQARRWVGLVALLVVVAAAGGAAWWAQERAAPPAASAVPVVVPKEPAAVPASAAAALPPSAAVSTLAAPMEAQPVVPEPAPSAVASGAMVLRMESSLSARRALDALLSTPTPPPVAATVSAAPPAAQPVNAAASAVTKIRGQASAPVPAQAVASAAAPAPGAGTPREVVPVVQRQQQAGADVVAQAQSLWQTGARDAAADLVQQSIAVAERTAKTGGNTGPNPALLPLVREMARMHLAEARYGAVWELLTRLEPQLGNQPDLWAIRANAAQRLGRHPDSVHAYMMALQSRPDEQRWLLGAAVSLAALGQTSSAAEMAEKARSVGPVSKDVLAYLRQAGVPLRE